jgi:hypothetical protein
MGSDGGYVWVCLKVVDNGYPFPSNGTFGNGVVMIDHELFVVSLFSGKTQNMHNWVFHR